MTYCRYLSRIATLTLFIFIATNIWASALKHIDGIANGVSLETTSDSTKPARFVFNSIQIGLNTGFGFLMGESSQSLKASFKAARPHVGLNISMPINEYLNVRLQGAVFQLANKTVEIQSKTLIGGGGIGIDGGFFLDTRRPKLVKIYAMTGFWGNRGRVTSKVDSTVQKNISFRSVPLGAGLRFQLSNSWCVRAEINYHISSTDLLDGIERGQSRDSYLQAGLTVVKQFYFRRRTAPPNPIFSATSLLSKDTIWDKDYDGVPDSLDQCPDMKGPIFALGCPDMDQDSIPDKDDLCKEIPGSRHTKGCPDPDGDGLAGKDDPCPNLKGTLTDADNDGIKDNLEKDSICICNPNPNCPCQEKCPGSCDPEKDVDADGILNSKDNCPCIKGVACNNGCPLEPGADYDGDKIINDKDDCPCEKGVECNKGCPLPPTGDYDSDGVNNSNDRCPCDKGPSCNNGCPNGGDDDCDGLTGSEEKCPKIQGKKVGGKLDSDGDGELDVEDICDCEPARKNCHCGCPSGCDPNADTDGDGVRNASDVNPCIKDMDNDRVPDREDNCPALPGPPENKGCPVNRSKGKQEP